MPESPSLSELTRQITLPTKNGHTPPPTESRKSHQSASPVPHWIFLAPLSNSNWSNSSLLLGSQFYSLDLYVYPYASTTLFFGSLSFLVSFEIVQCVLQWFSSFLSIHFLIYVCWIFFFFFLSSTARLWVLSSLMEPGPWQWKHRVLTTGSPGNSWISFKAWSALDLVLAQK